MSEAREAAVARLEARLGWTFGDRTLLERALTHASAGRAGQKRRDNERLEFLGDRVLGLMVAERLTRDFPDAAEGQLSPRLHALVNRRACARAARAAGLGEALRMAPGEAKQGGRTNETILGDACEALIAALYLDAGLDRTREIWAELWRDQFDDPFAGSADGAKSRLQEWAQGRGLPLPTYAVVDRSGPDHAPRFTVEVAVESVAPVRAEGSSRQEAEKAAAAGMVAREGV